MFDSLSITHSGPLLPVKSGCYFCRRVLGARGGGRREGRPDLGEVRAGLLAEPVVEPRVLDDSILAVADRHVGVPHEVGRDPKLLGPLPTRQLLRRREGQIGLLRRCEPRVLVDPREPPEAIPVLFVPGRGDGVLRREDEGPRLREIARRRLAGRLVQLLGGLTESLQNRPRPLRHGLALVVGAVVRARAREVAVRLGEAFLDVPLVELSLGLGRVGDRCRRVDRALRGLDRGRDLVGDGCRRALAASCSAWLAQHDKSSVLFSRKKFFEETGRNPQKLR